MKKFTIELLFALCVASAAGATYYRSDERAFALWSSISSGTLGAALGLIQGSNRDDGDKYL
jgi:hypothetical protein